jgi:hypothetical protein
METEIALLETRRQAKKGRISGQQLELFDADCKSSLPSKQVPRLGSAKTQQRSGTYLATHSRQA